MKTEEPLVAAADGSALGNPGPAGWAWYIDENRWASGGYEHGTNNMGELKAVLDLFESTAHIPDRPLHVLCDSQYTIKSITQWMPGWKKKGWKKSDGKPVLNLELIQALDTALTGRAYTFEWVKGHTGHRLNEKADDLARAAATAFRDGKKPNPGPGLGTETKAESTPGAGATTQALEFENLLYRGRQNRSEVEALLADDLIWITPAGHRVDRVTVLEHRQRALTGEINPEVIRAEELGNRALLICTRVETARGQVIRTSIWQKTDSWQLHFRQETAC